MLIRLQRYVLRELLVVFVLSTTVVSALITLGLSVQLIGDGLMPAQLTRVIHFIVPFTWPFAVPSGLLIACVMVFGRLAGDNELLAIRSSGVSLWRVIWPALAAGFVLTLVSVYLNNNVLPWCHRQLEERQEALIGPLLARLAPSRERIEISPYVIHIGEVDPEDFSRWHRVVAARYARNHITQIIIARYGSASYYPETNRAELVLTDGWIIQPIGDEENLISFEDDDIRYTIDLSDDSSRPYRGEGEHFPSDVRSMPFSQVLRHRARLAEFVEPMAQLADPRAVRRELQRRHSELNQDRRDISSEQNRHASRVEELEKENRDFRSQKNSLEERLNYLREDLQSRSEMLRHLESRMLDTRSSLITVPEDSEQAEELNDTLRSQERRREEIRGGIQRVEGEIEDIKLRISRFADRIESNKRRLESESEKADELEGQVSELSEAVSDMARRVEEADLQELYRRANIEVHFRMGQAFACIVFVMIGIPFGIMVRRGGVVAAFGISFAVVLMLYFPAYYIGRQLAEAGQLPAYIALWLPNLICGAIGALFLWLSLRR